MATMLRSLGIPARTASGYAQGTFDEDSGLYIITDRDAHTWVEVFFPAYGWIEFEPTAGEDPLLRPSGAEDFAEPAVPGMPDDFQGDVAPQQPLPDENFDPGLDQLPEDGFFGDFAGEAVDRAPWWLWAVVTPLVLIGAALLALLLLPLSFAAAHLGAVAAIEPSHDLVSVSCALERRSPEGVAPLPNSWPRRQSVIRWMRPRERVRDRAPRGDIDC